jgi:hypothetical protein
MMYEFLWDCLVLDNFMNGFNLYFEVCGHLAQGHVHCQYHIFFLHFDSYRWRNILETYFPL